MKKTTILLLIMATVFASGAYAQIPKTINYQGVLTDDMGAAVPDGSYTLTLRLYTVLTGGSPIWDCDETVTVTKGIFNAVLGESCVLTPEFNQLYYLGISVDGGPELTPRTPLTSAPYSIGALSVTGADNVFPGDGYVGIGTTTPSNRLTVEDENQVGIQFNGTNDYWASIYINAVNAGARPTIGWMRQSVLRASASVSTADVWQLRMNGTTRFSVADDGRTGINMSPGTEALSVAGAVQLGNSVSTTTGAIRWTGSDFEGYTGSAWESFTSGGSGSLPSGTSGQTLRHNGSDWIANNGIHNNGTYVGIGTVTPTAKLNVGGGEWDLTNTEGDFKIGDATYRLKFGVATDGGGAGSAGIRVAGGAEKLFLGAGSNEVLEIDNAGYFKIGSVNNSGIAQVYREGIATNVASISHTLDGGRFTFSDENGNSALYGGADGSHTGGNLYVKRDAVNYGFYVEGNWAGLEEPGMGIVGSARSATFRMDEAGDESVTLPVDAVSASEILDEPGVASSGLDAGIYLTGIGTVDVLNSCSITTPGAGYVLVIASGYSFISHVSGSYSQARFGVSNSTSAFIDNQTLYVLMDNGATSGYYNSPMTSHYVFPVASAGTHTFYVLGELLEGSAVGLGDIEMSCIYIPTSYGSIVTSTASTDKSKPGTIVAAAPLSQTDIEEERAASTRNNDERILRELEEMRARIAELERELENER